MNQTCKVCGEPAAGFHFGAFTCEGCKSFFGRSYNNLSSINECKNNGKCVIDKKNRTTCKACRLRKCYTVGMSKGGSRYGRRSNWFKIHCLLQEQQEQAVEAACKAANVIRPSIDSDSIGNFNNITAAAAVAAVVKQNIKHQQHQQQHHHSTAGNEHKKDLLGGYHGYFPQIRISSAENVHHQQQHRNHHHHHHHHHQNPNYSMMNSFTSAIGGGGGGGGGSPFPSYLLFRGYNSNIQPAVSDLGFHTEMFQYLRATGDATFPYQLRNYGIDGAAFDYGKCKPSIVTDVTPDKSLALVDGVKTSEISRTLSLSPYSTSSISISPAPRNSTTPAIAIASSLSPNSSINSDTITESHTSSSHASARPLTFNSELSSVGGGGEEEERNKQQSTIAETTTPTPTTTTTTAQNPMPNETFSPVYISSVSIDAYANTRTIITDHNQDYPMDLSVKTSSHPSCESDSQSEISETTTTTTTTATTTTYPTTTHTVLRRRKFCHRSSCDQDSDDDDSSNVYSMLEGIKRPKLSNAEKNYNDLKHNTATTMRSIFVCV